MTLHDKIGRFSSQLNNCTSAFAQDPRAGNAAGVLYVLAILSHSMLTQGSRFNKINNFYCFIKDILKGHWLFSF